MLDWTTPPLDSIDRRRFVALAGIAVAFRETGAHPAVHEWDMSWVDRLTGKYRAVFDSAEINDGAAFGNAFVFMRGYQEVYGASDSDTQAVIVMRSRGVHMAFNNVIWQNYKLADFLKTKGSENPYLAPMAGLHAKGATLLACNLAATYYAQEMAKRIGSDPTAAVAEAKANLAPGVVLQPSGVFATLRAQQAGCWFLRSE